MFCQIIVKVENLVHRRGFKISFHNFPFGHRIMNILYLAKGQHNEIF